MRPNGSAPLSALLVLAPLVALPILAVVGIPNFAGGNLIDSQNPSASSATRRSSVGSETRLGEDAHSDADDLFAPLGKSTNGFEDPLRRSKKKMRSRTSRNENSDLDFENAASDSGDSLDSETGARSRSRPKGKSSRFANTNEEESVDSDADSELNSASTSGRASRSRLRSQNRGGEFDDNTTDDADITLQNDENSSSAAGEQYADASDDFTNSPKTTRPRGNQIKRAAQSSEETDADLFENSAPPKVLRNTPKVSNGSRPPAARTRSADPNDAPLFQPSKSQPNMADAESEPVDQPVATSPRKPSPRSQSMASLPDNTAGSARGAAGVGNAPTVSTPQEQTLKDLFDSLKAAGMVAESHHFVYVEESDTFLFTCRASRGGNATPQKFEEEASEPLLAVYKVLKRVQGWQKTSKKLAK